jgi:hypothetical protein
MSDLYVSQRDVTITSTSGHTIFFPKGVPKAVPFDLRRACLEQGVLPAENTDLTDLGGRVPPARAEAPLSRDERDDLIREAIGEMLSTRKRGDFTAAGMPRVDQMSKLTGFEVNPADRDRLWLELRQGAGA